MESPINRSKLIQLIADSYTVPELEGFLEDYFKRRLDHIVEPRGLSVIEVARKVVNHFDREGYLVDLVRELGHHRPGKIDILDLLMVSSTTGSSNSTASSRMASSTKVEIDANEVDFYFLTEPDRRFFPLATEHQPSTQTLFVRIPVISRAQSTISPPPQALALAVDRSGSMAEEKIIIARTAAEYLLDLVQGSNSQVAILAFDQHIKLVVPLQQIKRATAHKRNLNNIASRGWTDLFSVWERAVTTLRTLNGSWNRRVVLITDGFLNYGMKDPAIFEEKVATVWKTDHISTTCISMGTEWNVDLLSKLASAGGGSAHFIGSKSQANQVMHEIFYSASGVVAHNVRVELEPLNSTQVIRVNDEPISLLTGQVGTFLMTNQLMINSEEYLVARLEIPSPKTKQKVALLQCTILYESPLSGQPRKTPDKILTISGRSIDLASEQTLVNQGVICTAHIISSRELYRKALDAYQVQNEQLGDALLAQAKITLQAIPTIPKGYESRVLVQEGRIQHLEQASTKQRSENIKRLYFEEWAHREALWEKVYIIFDQLLAASREQFLHNADEQFMWAHHMIAENAFQLPIPLVSNGVPNGEPIANPDTSSQSDEDLFPYWKTIGQWNYTSIEEPARRSNRRNPEQRQEEQAEPAIVLALLAGACCGLEQYRQGAQEELEELLESYIESRYRIQLLI